MQPVKPIMKAMKKTNPDAVWVAQAWQDNPRTSMIEHLEAGDLLVLDLHSECRPQWGIRHQNGVAKGDMDNMGGCIVCF